MKSTRANYTNLIFSWALWGTLLPMVAGWASEATAQGVQFQRPSQAKPASAAGVRFQSSQQAAQVQKQEDGTSPASRPATQEAAPADQEKVQNSGLNQAAPSQSSAKQQETPIPELREKRVVAKPVRPAVRQDDSFLFANHEEDHYDVHAYEVGDPSWEVPMQMMQSRGPYLADPSCGVMDPGCGIVEPGCGIMDPGCGIYEPSCGCAEPSCGVGGCGSVVGRPGPDYWCFPVCLPRFKDFTAWAGVQGFRGPRDFANQRSDSNFGFHQGVNFSGRAPLVSLFFPQLSYQAGYQAVQSRLSGTVDSPDDRLQQFVTAGLFRRVDTGLQFGVAWDKMRDDLDNQIDLYQVRYELSVKGMRGNEFGARASHGTNTAISGGVEFEAVDQYAFFYRRHFAQGYEGRLWGGATGDGAGLFGGDFYAALSDRFSLQTGFNYLIPQEEPSLAAVTEESWNIAVNVVWHMGQTAKTGTRSPYRPLFPVADNGWMFVKPVN